MATNLERFTATVEHRRPEQMLYHAGFTPGLRQRVIEHIGTDDIRGHYGFDSGTGTWPRKPADYVELDFSRYWEGEDLPDGTTINGIGVASVPSGFHHFVGLLSPLRNATSLAEIEQFPMVDYSLWDDSHMAGDVEKAHAAGKSVSVGIGHMYESAWQIRGYEPFLLDTIERPAWAECLLEKLHQQKMVLALAAARSGADCIACGDDVANQNAMMFSVDTWQKLMRSRWEKVWQEAKAIHPGIRVRYHSDGNIFAIVGELIDAGVDILNPVQPECMDTDEIFRRYGDRLSFDGCIGTQSTMPFGTADDVRARVKECIDKYGQHGGLILSPTHVLEPEVPLANIDAFAEACREFGDSSRG